MNKLSAISINPHMDQTLQTTVFSEGPLTGAQCFNLSHFWVRREIVVIAK